jgi:hypothetical protein
MNWITKFENVALKIEAFFNNMDFIARLSTALSVGMNAFNDTLLKRNTEALKQYKDARSQTTK